MTRDEEKALIEARMFNGEPFTFKDLLGLSGLNSRDHRLAEGLIQKNRRAGRIAFTYEKGRPVWRAVAP